MYEAFIIKEMISFLIASSDVRFSVRLTEGKCSSSIRSLGGHFPIESGAHSFPSQTGNQFMMRANSFTIRLILIMAQCHTDQRLHSLLLAQFRTKSGLTFRIGVSLLKYIEIL